MAHSGTPGNGGANAKGKGKGKPMPAEGSANPSASFASLWNYIEPALDHIVRSSTNNPDKPPSIDVAYHMGIHTAVYNYFTSVSRFGVDALAAPRLAPNSNSALPGRGGESRSIALNGVARPPTPPGNTHGADLYDKLDKYYSDICLELLASAPVDDSSLLHYLLPCWRRYHAGANAVHRLLNYVNRHYVKRAVEEDRGWLRLADILDAVAQAIEENQPREQLAARLRERRLNELKRWGYAEGASPEALARAEAAAEAASPPDRIVPLSSMANRRFREVVIKPLLAVPKVKKVGTGGGGGKKRYRKPPNPNHVLHHVSSAADSSENPFAGPKSRLARAVKELIESRDTDPLEERRQMAEETNDMLETVGIPVDHALRKKLDKFLLRPQGSG
ncbi:hypothetical protein A7U60_g1602 [Sanghuangporus baumii]|uniref:Cullin N-terminal domain-containing protein n=1 Tax=Sanghuangporus baumii TaxID=108892 RepID=A0A9Q5I3S7_SANBA|nr:hypothetical protein A7U60_g1602 [Sanghuangporus baumii]